MSASALQPGSELERGKYRIVRRLGQGAMGIVYEAEHVVTHKRVAIKWMHPSVAAASGGARMVREAQAAVRVRHRHAVDVYDVVQDGDTVFLVMEYLEGETLSALLGRNDVPLHRVIALLLPAMRAVAAAHRKGVVHRDIKPENIFLAREDDSDEPVPKVLDFGISKLDHGDLPHESLTHEGSAIGTPRYMSLEQLSGDRQLDGRADVYAFGVILYEALTGRPPFDARSFGALIGQMITKEPSSPKTLRPEIPTPLDKLTMWAIARERDARLPSIDAFIQELEPFASARGFQFEMTSDGTLLAAMPVARADSQIRKVSSSPAPALPALPAPLVAAPRRRGRWKVGVVIALLVLATTVVVIWPRGEDAPRPPAATETPKIWTVQPVAPKPAPPAVGETRDGSPAPPVAMPAAPSSSSSVESPTPSEKPVRRWGPRKKNAAPAGSDAQPQVAAPDAAEKPEARDGGAPPDAQKPAPSAEPPGRNPLRVRLPQTGEF